jgi:hypothetical protein
MRLGFSANSAWPGSWPSYSRNRAQGVSFYYRRDVSLPFLSSSLR